MESTNRSERKRIEYQMIIGSVPHRKRIGQWIISIYQQLVEELVIMFVLDHIEHKEFSLGNRFELIFGFQHAILFHRKMIKVLEYQWIAKVTQQRLKELDYQVTSYSHTLYQQKLISEKVTFSSILLKIMLYRIFFIFIETVICYTNAVSPIEQVMNISVGSNASIRFILYRF